MERSNGEHFFLAFKREIQNALLRITRKLSSVVLWIWIVLLVCRIKYGESWNEILLLSTAAVLFNRVSNQYFESKYKNVKSFRQNNREHYD